MIVYACVYGWRSFFSTCSNHWCRVNKSEGVIAHNIIDGWVIWNNHTVKVIDNPDDTPSELETDFCGNQYKNQ